MANLVNDVQPTCVKLHYIYVKSLFSGFPAHGQLTTCWVFHTYRKEILHLSYKANHVKDIWTKLIIFLCLFRQVASTRTNKTTDKAIADHLRTANSLLQSVITSI